jgi:uncharacterized protein (TIGR03067 family)
MSVEPLGTGNDKMRFMIALLFVCVGPVKVSADDQTKNTLIGSWEPVSVVINGSTIEGDERQKFTGQLVFTSDSYTLTRKDSTLHYQYRIYSDKNPKQFDVWWSSEKELLDKKQNPQEQRPPDTKGIFAIEDNGQSLRRCYSPRGRARPKEFESLGGSENILTVHKRSQQKMPLP